MKQTLVFLYGVTCYALFLGVFLYAIAWVGNLGVPNALDAAPRVPLHEALATNIALLTVFTLQHSLMARRSFKERWTKIVPKPAERSTYVLFTNLALMLMFWQWQPIGGALWSIELPAMKALVYTLFALGWLLVLLSTFLINHFDLFGLRQVWLYFRGREYTPLPFKTPALYRVIRHPLYLGWFLAFWATPTMTAAHFLFASMTTAYILMAIRWEERDLLRAYGEVYAAYRQQVPMLIPRLRLPKTAPAPEPQTEASR